MTGAPGSPDREIGNDARTRILPVALSLVGQVRERDRRAYGRRLQSMPRQDLVALAVVLAALVPDDRSAADLLAWISFDDDGSPLPRARVARSERTAA